jgi:hypothetical protein
MLNPPIRDRIKMKHVIHINKLIGGRIGAAIEVHEHVH